MKSPYAILAAVARRYGVGVLDLKGPSRDPTVVRARHDAMLELRDRLGFTQGAIGALVNRNNRTVSDGIKAATARRKMPPTNVRRLTPGEIKIIAEMQAEGFGVDPIARRLQCSKHVLKREFKLATGEDLRPSTRNQHSAKLRDPVTAWAIGEVPKGHPLYESDQEMLRGRQQRVPYEAYPRQSSLADF